MTMDYVSKSQCKYYQRTDCIFCPDNEICLKAMLGVTPENHVQLGLKFE